MITDVVAVLDDQYQQVFEGARPMKATVKEDSKTMEHPLESGAIITDHRIVLPVEIELAVIPRAEQFNDVYAEIKQLFIKGTLLTVQTRTGRYSSMLIQSMPHDESADMFDTCPIALKLKEVRIVVSKVGKGYAPKKKKQSPRVEAGQKQTEKPSKSEAATAVDATRKYVKSVFGL